MWLKKTPRRQEVQNRCRVDRILQRSWIVYDSINKLRPFWDSWWSKSRALFDLHADNLKNNFRRVTGRACPLCWTPHLPSGWSVSGSDECPNILSTQLWRRIDLRRWWPRKWQNFVHLPLRPCLWDQDSEANRKHPTESLRRYYWSGGILWVPHRHFYRRDPCQELSLWPNRVILPSEPWCRQSSRKRVGGGCDPWSKSEDQNMAWSLMAMLPN